MSITHHQCSFTRVATFFSFCDEEDLLKEKKASICSSSMHSEGVLGTKQGIDKFLYNSYM